MKSYITKEADVFLEIYTKEFGLLGILASGVRLQKSKLKSFLQPYSHGSFGFVKGKQILRLTHASGIGAISDVEKLKILARFFERIRRMVRGEERNTEIYKISEDIFLFLSEEKEIDQRKSFLLEIIFLMRLLLNLGYWAERIEDAPYLRAPFSLDLLFEIELRKKEYLERIQEALALSQL